MSLTLENLEFGSVFSYTPRPVSNFPHILEDMKKTKDLVYWLKQDRIVRWKGNDTAMSDYVAEVLDEVLPGSDFSHFFEEGTILVPAPRNAPNRPGGLWVPERIANAMLRRGIGDEVIPCLIRAAAVNKSAQSDPSKRPLPQEHYESFEVKDVLAEFNTVVIVDDVITRGSTLLGAANKLVEEFPWAKVYGFAAVRTLSDASSYTSWVDPVKGSITLRSIGDTMRNP